MESVENYCCFSSLLKIHVCSLHPGRVLLCASFRLLNFIQVEELFPFHSLVSFCVGLASCLWKTATWFTSVCNSGVQQSCCDSETSSWLSSEEFCRRVSCRRWKANWVLHIYLDYQGLFICFIYPIFCVLHLNLFVLALATSDLAAACIYLNKGCWE